LRDFLEIDRFVGWVVGKFARKSLPGNQFPGSELKSAKADWKQIQPVSNGFQL
jgi:hypothetical protein